MPIIPTLISKDIDTEAVAELEQNEREETFITSADGDTSSMSIDWTTTWEYGDQMFQHDIHRPVEIPSTAWDFDPTTNETHGFGEEFDDWLEYPDEHTLRIHTFNYGPLGGGGEPASMEVIRTNAINLTDDDNYYIYFEWKDLYDSTYKNLYFGETYYGLYWNYTLFENDDWSGNNISYTGHNGLMADEWTFMQIYDINDELDGFQSMSITPAGSQMAGEHDLYIRYFMVCHFGNTEQRPDIMNNQTLSDAGYSDAVYDVPDFYQQTFYNETDFVEFYVTENDVTTSHDNDTLTITENGASTHGYYYETIDSYDYAGFVWEYYCSDVPSSASHQLIVYNGTWITVNPLNSTEYMQRGMLNSSIGAITRIGLNISGDGLAVDLEWITLMPMNRSGWCHDGGIDTGITWWYQDHTHYLYSTNGGFVWENASAEYPYYYKMDWVETNMTGKPGYGGGGTEGAWIPHDITETTNQGYQPLMPFWYDIGYDCMISKTRVMEGSYVNPYAGQYPTTHFESGEGGPTGETTYGIDGNGYVDRSVMLNYTSWNTYAPTGESPWIIANQTYREERLSGPHTGDYDYEGFAIRHTMHTNLAYARPQVVQTDYFLWYGIVGFTAHSVEFNGAIASYEYASIWYNRETEIVNAEVNVYYTSDIDEPDDYVYLEWQPAYGTDFSLNTSTFNGYSFSELTFEDAEDDYGVEHHTYGLKLYSAATGWDLYEYPQYYGALDSATYTNLRVGFTCDGTDRGIDLDNFTIGTLSFFTDNTAPVLEDFWILPYTPTEGAATTLAIRVTEAVEVQAVTALALEYPTGFNPGPYTFTANDVDSTIWNYTFSDGVDRGYYIWRVNISDSVWTTNGYQASQVGEPSVGLLDIRFAFFDNSANWIPFETLNCTLRNNGEEYFLTTPTASVDSTQSINLEVRNLWGIVLYNQTFSYTQFKPITLNIYELIVDNEADHLVRLDMSYNGTYPNITIMLPRNFPRFLYLAPANYTMVFTYYEASDTDLVTDYYEVTGSYVSFNYEFTDIGYLKYTGISMADINFNIDYTRTETNNNIDEVDYHVQNIPIPNVPYAVSPTDFWNAIIWLGAISLLFAVGGHGIKGWQIARKTKVFFKNETNNDEAYREEING